MVRFLQQGRQIRICSWQEKVGIYRQGQSGGLWMKNYQKEISGVWRILAKPTWWDSWWRQARVIRYSMWGMRNLIRYRGDQIPRVRGFSAKWLNKILTKAGPKGQGQSSKSGPGRQRAKRICMRLWLRRESLWWWEEEVYL